MKILNVNSYYYSSSVHKDLQMAIDKYEKDVKTYVPLVKGYIPRKECIYLADESIKVSECFNKFDRYIFHLKHGKILKDIEENININEFNFVHAHSLFSNGYIAMKIKEQFGIPYIVAMRDTDLNIFFKYLIYLRGLGVKILREASNIVFLSEPYRDYLIQNYIPIKLREEIMIKSRIIPNGINDFWHENKGIEKSMKNKQKIKILYVGAINKRKNINTTIKAINMLKDKGYIIEYTIVGSDMDKSISDSFKDLPYINYVQPVSKENLIGIYRDNDIFVMPSITETFGLVYAEAMSQGLPIIYTRGQGFDGHFEEGIVGYSVDCFDSNEIAESIIKIVDNYEKISRDCINLFKIFDWNKIASKYISLYIK